MRSRLLRRPIPQPFRPLSRRHARRPNPMLMPRNLGTVTASSPIVQSISSAITRQEGATKNNNPGNLVYAGQPGAIGVDSRGFAIFSTPQQGADAEANQVALLINRGTCVSGAPTTDITGIISCWAPPSQNDTATYVANVSSWTGIDPYTNLQNDQPGSIQTLYAYSGTPSTVTDPTQTDSAAVFDPTTLAVAAGV